MEQSVEFLIKSHYAQLRTSEKKDAERVLYGYQLKPQDTMESVPGKVVSGTIAMMEEMLKSIAVSDKADLKCQKSAYFLCGKFGGDRSGSDDKTVISGDRLPVLYGLLPAETRCLESASG